MERSEGEGRFRPRALNAQDAQIRRVGGRVLQQRRQPNAVLAAQHKRATSPRAASLDQTVQCLQLAVATEQLHSA